MEQERRYIDLKASGEEHDRAREMEMDSEDYPYDKLRSETIGEEIKEIDEAIAQEEYAHEQYEKNMERMKGRKKQLEDLLSKKDNF